MGPRLSEAPDIDRIALSEVRLLKEAQRGNPEALRPLVEPHLNGVWAVCAAHCPDRDGALATLLAFRDRLLADVRSFTVDVPFGVQLYRALWLHLRDPAEPEAAAGIEATAAPEPRRTLPAWGPEEAEPHIRRALAAAPANTRLIYLLGVATELPAPRLAEVIGESEQRVREARARVVTLLHEALTR